MKVKQDTYTLWHDDKLINTLPHTRDSYDEFLEWAYGVDGTVAIFSSREGDAVWTSDDSMLLNSPQSQPSEQPYDGWEGSWAGDGSGMDDLADFNTMEGCDYE
jgi:hypothetical protein